MHHDCELVMIDLCSLTDCRQSFFAVFQLLFDLCYVCSDENIITEKLSGYQYIFCYCAVFKLVYVLHYLLSQMSLILQRCIEACYHQLSDEAEENFTD